MARGVRARTEAASLFPPLEDTRTHATQFSALLLFPG